MLEKETKKKERVRRKTQGQKYRKNSGEGMKRKWKIEWREQINLVKYDEIKNGNLLISVKFHAVFYLTQVTAVSCHVPEKELMENYFRRIIAGIQII